MLEDQEKKSVEKNLRFFVLNCAIVYFVMRLPRWIVVKAKYREIRNFRLRNISFCKRNKNCVVNQVSGSFAHIKANEEMKNEEQKISA